MPYVRPCVLNTSTSYASVNGLDHSESSNTTDTGTGLAGSVMSMTCTPLSPAAATMPYVLPFMLNTSTSSGPARAVNPPASSNTTDTGTGFVGSVTSMICTPSSYPAATAAYVLSSMLNTSASSGLARAVNPPVPSNTADAGAGCAGSVTSMICTPSSDQATTTAYVLSSMLNTSTSRAPSKALNPPVPSNTADTGAGSPTTGFTCPTDVGKDPMAAVDTISASGHLSMLE